MRVLAHLSDLHFGAHTDVVIRAVHDAIAAVRPHLIVVSGDLTQRARRQEFAQARQFLDQLPPPLLVVPGNHDVPLYNVAARFLNPLGSYRRYISDDLSPVFADDEIVVVGLNSARARSFAHGPGRVNESQVLRAVAQLNLAPADRLRIVVTHHPFDVPESHGAEHVIGGADVAIPWLAAVNVDVFLAGHLHVSHIGHTAERYRIAGHSALVVQAGTLSRRARGEVAAFNVLRLTAARIDIERVTWDERTSGFVHGPADVFNRTAGGWRVATDAPDAPSLPEPAQVP